MKKLLLIVIAGLLQAPAAAWAEEAAAEQQPDSKVGGQLDRLQLDATAITGNQELPRVMYIVPWQESGIGELAGRPVNSLLDEVLAPIDREVFQREVRYFDQLYGSATEE